MTCTTEQYRQTFEERALPTNFMMLINLFHEKMLQQNVDDIHDLLDELKPFVYGQFNLEIISLLKRINKYIVTKEQYLAKYYFYCGQAYHYIDEQQESIKYYKLAISYGTKYKQYKIVSYALWNIEQDQYTKMNLQHADEMSRVLTTFYSMDNSIFESYNRMYLPHIRVAFQCEQYEYVEQLINDKVREMIPLHSADWIDLQVALASIAEKRGDYRKAFELYSLIYVKLKPALLKSKTFKIIVENLNKLLKILEAQGDVLWIRDHLLNEYEAVAPFILNEKSTYDVTNLHNGVRQEQFEHYMNHLFLFNKSVNVIQLKCNMKDSKLSLDQVFNHFINEMKWEYKMNQFKSMVDAKGNLYIVGESNHQVEQIVEKVLESMREKMFSTAKSPIFYSLVIDCNKYELHDYKDVFKLSRAFLYYRFYKQV